MTNILKFNPKLRVNVNNFISFMASIRSFFTALFIVARISPMYFHRSMKQRKNLALRFLCFVLFVLFVLLFLMMAMLRTAAVADATNRDLMNSIEVFHNPIEI